MVPIQSLVFDFLIIPTFGVLRRLSDLLIGQFCRPKRPFELSLQLLVHRRSWHEDLLPNRTGTMAGQAATVEFEFTTAAGTLFLLRAAHLSTAHMPMPSLAGTSEKASNDDP